MRLRLIWAETHGAISMENIGKLLRIPLLNFPLVIAIVIPC